VFDAPLTPRGRAQARAVRPRLQDLLARRERELGAALWVTSPLTRALETMLLACPHGDRLGAGSAAGSAAAVGAAAGGSGVATQQERQQLLQQQHQQHQHQQPQQHQHQHQHLQHQQARLPLGAAAGANGPAPPSSAAAAGAQDAAAAAAPAPNDPTAPPPPPPPPPPVPPPAPPLRLEVLPLIAEHCATTGDVGRPPHLLAASFPQLSSHLAALPSPSWWYDPHGPDGPRANVGHGPSARLAAPEPAAHMRGRVGEFGRWLSARPERLVVAVGHSTFFRSLTRARVRMRNCEVQVMWW